MIMITIKNIRMIKYKITQKNNNNNLTQHSLQREYYKIVECIDRKNIMFLRLRKVKVS